ncbi:MAG: hypothetical protein J6Y16_04985 [Treponema sp.]|nr:hypothetical protein [Treponema sp.]
MPAIKIITIAAVSFFIIDPLSIIISFNWIIAAYKRHDRHSVCGWFIRLVDKGLHRYRGFVKQDQIPD